MSPDSPELPPDLHPVAAALGREGQSARRQGVELADRVAMRTAHLLGETAAPEPPVGALGRLLLWLAGPAMVAAAGLTLFIMLRPGLGGGPASAPTAEVIAANLERDLDAWLELDAEWNRDAFENRLAVLSIETAGVATPADDLPALPADGAGS